MGIFGNSLIKINIDLVMKRENKSFKVEAKKIEILSKDSYSLLINKEIQELLKKNELSEENQYFFSIGVSSSIDDFLPSYKLDLDTIQILYAYNIKFVDIDVYL